MKPLLIVISSYYPQISAQLLSGAERAITAADFSFETIEVPGALEIAPAIALAVASKKYSGYVALGCVLRGETSHYDTVAHESARGLMDLSVRERAAIGNGILTCEREEQAVARANPVLGNKGGEAANAALRLIAIAKQLGVSA
jgi:6,7-dimethyl-8-ribityllumazine synthase